MDWTKHEIAADLGTDMATLDRFLNALDCPTSPPYIERDKDRLVNLWATTGAAEQYAVEGKLTPRYEDHMESQAWDLVRRDALQKAEYRCQICNANKPVDGHHRSHKRMGSPEEGRNVIALCRPCHDLVTQAKRSKQDLIRLSQARR